MARAFPLLLELHERPHERLPRTSLRRSYRPRAGTRRRAFTLDARGIPLGLARVAPLVDGFDVFFDLLAEVL
jgi:hypothetical protein